MYKQLIIILGLSVMGFQINPNYGPIPLPIRVPCYPQTGVSDLTIWVSTLKGTPQQDITADLQTALTCANGSGEMLNGCQWGYSLQLFQAQADGTYKPMALKEQQADALSCNQNKQWDSGKINFGYWDKGGYRIIGLTAGNNSPVQPIPVSHFFNVILY